MAKFKEVAMYFSEELNTYKAKVVNLEGKHYWHVKELMKENSELKSELTSLPKQVENARADAVVEFPTSTVYYNELGVQFNEGFNHFHVQALELSKDSGLDFSQVQINLE